MQNLHRVNPGLDTLGERRSRSELSSHLDIPVFLDQLDRRPGLTGAGVIYFNGIDVLMVREFQPICQVNPVNVVIRAAPRGSVSGIQPTNSVLEQKNTPMYSTLREAGSAGIACGAAVLSWVVVAGSSLALVPSVGSSTAVTVLAYTAAAASTAQCVIGVGRTTAVLSGYDEGLAWLDSNDWYTKTMTALDIVSIAGAGTASVATIKTLTALRSAGSTSVLEALKSMPRHERKRLTEALIRQMHPGISNAAMKAFIRAGVYPARFSSTQVSNALTRTHQCG